MKVHRFSVSIQGSAFIFLALMLLLLPLSWVVAAVLAAVIHEVFHVVATILLSSRIYCLQVGAGGAKMDVAPMPAHRELIAAAAGPVGSALLVLLGRWMPRTAICAFVHCVYNLLPLYPLDGGRILSCISACLFPGEKGERMFYYFQKILRILFLIICVPVGLRWGILPATALTLALVRKRNTRTV